MTTPDFTPACPLPIQQYPHVLMATAAAAS